MIFTMLLMDRPGTADLRVQVRPEHRAYLAKMADRMAFAGPLTSEDGKTTLGYEVSVAEARELNKEHRQLFAAYHKDKKRPLTPWISSVEFGVGKQNLNKKLGGTLFIKPPPRRKKYLP